MAVVHPSGRFLYVSFDLGVIAGYSIDGQGRLAGTLSDGDARRAADEQQQRDDAPTSRHFLPPRPFFGFGFAFDFVDFGLRGLRNGFDPNLIYTVVFPVKDPYVLGIGFASFRDLGSFFRYASADDFGACAFFGDRRSIDDRPRSAAGRRTAAGVSPGRSRELYAADCTLSA